MTTEQIQTKANEMIAKGCKLTFDAICVILEKQEAAAAKKKFKPSSRNENAVNTLWGPGFKYSTQAEYQRSCLGSKWN